HDSFILATGPALELFADWSQQARGFTLFGVIVTARYKQQLPWPGLNIDGLRLLHKVLVGASRIAERDSGAPLFALGWLHQYVVNGETSSFPVRVFGTAAPPFHLVRIASAIEINARAR